MNPRSAVPSDAQDSRSSEVWLISYRDVLDADAATLRRVVTHEL